MIKHFMSTQLPRAGTAFALLIGTLFTSGCIKTESDDEDTKAPDIPGITVACEDDGDCDSGEICDDGECVDDSGEPSNVLVIGDSGGGGTVTTDSGTTLTFGDNSLSAGTTVTVEEVEYDTVESGGQTFDVVAGIEVEMDEPADEPPVITVPNDDNVEQDSQILIVEVVTLDDGTTGINVVGTASVTEDGEEIVSNNDSDDDMFVGEWGVDESGTYIIIVTDGNQGFTVGQVTDSDGNGVSGAAVFSSSGTFVGVTDDGGYFAIPETIGSTTLYVVDPETGGYANIYVAVGDVVVVVEITLVVPDTIADGLPNGCLDVDELDAYTITGNTSVVNTLDPIAPVQGGGMILMTTGDGAAEDKTSSMDITFTVPSDASELSLAYRFLTDEYPEYVGSQYNDLFNIIAYTGPQSTLLVEERVNDAEMEDSDTIYDGATAWKGVTINVEDFAGTGTPFTLSFVVSDVADTIYDTAVLIDDLKFDTGECDNPQTVVTEDADGDTYMTPEDCDDTDPAINPGAEEICGDEVDNNCDGAIDEDCGTVTDDDGDTYGADEDCDDTDPAINPGAIEICGDEVDNNCNGEADEDCNGIVDLDGDTYDAETDCDDNNADVYPNAPEACDSIDNDCDGDVDESCVQELPQSHHLDFSATNGFLSSDMYAIYQRFDDTTPVDLDGVTLSFVPDANHTRYTVTAGALSWDSDEGALLEGSATQCDDCYDAFALPFTFDFYGASYDEMFIGSNGYLTFGEGDSTYTESVEYFLADNPRISAMFDDLDTRGDDTVGDDILVYSDASKVVVTERNIQHFSTTGSSNTFQFVLLANGTIRISYDGIEDLTTGAIAGISPGMITTTTAK